MASAAAVRATAELAAGPVLLSVDNTIESLAALAGLAAAGIDCAVFESGSSLMQDEESALHALDAAVVVGAGHAPARYRTVHATDLTAPLPGRDALADLAALPPADPAVWQSTSGSTGEPRLARQSAANLVRGGLIYASRYRVTDQDILLTTMPMAHSFGLVGGYMCALATGAPLLAMTRFSPRSAREAMSYGATVALGTPLVYELLIRSARPAAGRLRIALSSGGPLDPQVAQAARQQLGCPIYQVYGCTEAGIIASQFPRDEPWPAGSVGAAAPAVRMRLAEPLSAVGGGELCVRTSTMFAGYLGVTAPVLDPDGWYRTGDLAAIDQAGHLSLLLRKDSFINVGGRKVSPSRVERIMAGHDAVAEVAVYGAEAVGGEEVLAAVAVSALCTEQELIAYCRAHMAPYEVPCRLYVVERLPRTGMGKVDRSRLPR